MSWKDTLAAIAPTLATAIGGPFAGAATKFLTGKFLGDGSTENDLQLFVEQASPEQLAEIKNADNEFKLKMEKMGVDVFALEVADKQNARTENKHSRMPAVISVGLTIFVMAIVYALFYSEPPQGAREVLFMLLGVVVKEWSNSLHFWFGTTRSSANKDMRK
jgi:hypothetical protein